jgi:hypothetical protein
MRPEVCVLLESYAAVYVEVPKVACTSLKVALAGLLGIDLASSGGNPHEGSFPSAAPSEDAHGPLFPNLFAFAFVRNPWDRLVSCYRDKIGGVVDGFTRFTIRPGVADCLAGFDAFTADMSFGEFVTAVASIPDEEADAHFRSQYTFVANAAGELAIDFVGQFETLLYDLQRVRERVGLPDVNLPRLQVAPGRVNYPVYYSTSSRRAVARRFQEDIELFKYQFEA